METWATPFYDIWGKIIGGKMPVNKFSKPLTDACKEYGETAAVEAWRRYLTEMKASGREEFANAATFLQTYGKWAKTSKPVSKWRLKLKSVYHLDLEDYVAEEWQRDLKAQFPTATDEILADAILAGSKKPLPNDKAKPNYSDIRERVGDYMTKLMAEQFEAIQKGCSHCYKGWLSAYNLRPPFDQYTAREWIVAYSGHIPCDCDAGQAIWGMGEYKKEWLQNRRPQMDALIPIAKEQRYYRELAMARPPSHDWQTGAVLAEESDEFSTPEGVIQF